METITRTLKPTRLIKRIDDQSNSSVERGRNSPTLSLDFVNQKYKLPLSNFSRASTATRFNANGVLVEAGVDELRQQFNPATGEYEGYLLEGEATNLNNNSSLFTDWSEATLSAPSAGYRFVEADAGLAPDGTMTADRITVSTDEDRQRIYKFPTSGSSFIYSIYLKSAGATYAGIRFTTTETIIVDLTNGTITSAPSHEHGVEDVGNGWYRLWLSNNGGTNGVIWIVFSSDGGGSAEGSDTFIGNGTDAIFAWGAQLEEGTEPSSYIPTSGSTVTRAADVGLSPPYSRYEELSFDDIFTYTRASYGTYWDENGVLQTALSGEPRFDHDLETGEPLGILIEQSATNIITNSEDFSDPVWLKSNGPTVSTTSETSPAGTAVQSINVSSQPSSRIAFSYSSAPAGTYTASVFLKSTTVDGTFGIRFLSQSTGSPSISQEVMIYADKWTRVHFTLTTTDVGNLIFYPATNQVPAELDEALVWGAQLEIGSLPTSYIPTSGSTASRSRDIIGLKPGSWFNSYSGVWRFSGTFYNATLLNEEAYIRRVLGEGNVVIRYIGSDGETWLNGAKEYSSINITQSVPSDLISTGHSHLRNLNYFPRPLEDNILGYLSDNDINVEAPYDPYLYIFNDGTDGFWGDSTDSATLFNSNNGINSIVGDQCGLRLDKSKELSLGPDIVENGDFSTGDLTGWINNSTSPASATVTTDKVVLQTGAGSNNDAEINQLITFSETGYYVVKAFISELVDDANVRISVVGGSVSNLDAQKIPPGSFTGFFVATAAGNATLRIENIRNDLNTSAAVGEIQVMRIAGNHQYQTASALKPTLQIINGVQSLTLDDSDDAMLIDVPTGGWTGTFVQGTALGVIVGEIDVPAGPYQIPTDPNYAGPGSDIHTVIVNDALPEGQINGLVEWVGQRCPARGFEGIDVSDYFRFRTDITNLDCSRWSGCGNALRFALSATNLVTAIVGPVFSSSTLQAGSFMETTTSLQSIDFSGANSSNVANWSRFFTRTGLTAAYLGDLSFDSGASLDFFFFASLNLESIDVSDNSFPAASTFARFADGCGNLTTLIIYGGSGSHFSASPCTDYTNAFRGTNLSQQSYTDLVTAIEAAGTSNGTLDITGGTSTTTGAAQTAVDALRLRGWTITTPDGY